MINTDEFSGLTLRIKAPPSRYCKLTQNPGCNTTQTIRSVGSQASLVFEKMAPLWGNRCSLLCRTCGRRGVLRSRPDNRWCNGGVPVHLP